MRRELTQGSFLYKNKGITPTIEKEVSVVSSMDLILENWKVFETGIKRKTPEKEVDEIFPGREGLRQLAQGMMEADELELEDDELELEELEEKKKKRRTQCIAGNPSHSPKDGRFQKRGQVGSWSIGQDDPGKGPPGCRRGVYRTTGRGDEVRIVRKPCGRLNKKDPDKKAPNKCSVREGSLPDLRTDLRTAVLETLGDLVKSLADDQTLNETDCPAGCSTFEQLIRSINAAVRASKGDLLKPGTK